VDEPIRKEAKVKVRNPFSGLFARSRSEEYVARYVVREHRRGRSLSSVLDDPYVRHWTTPEQRARLFERAEVVEAIGQETAESFARLTLTESPQASTPNTRM
jgi:hypothetical protein